MLNIPQRLPFQAACIYSLFFYDHPDCIDSPSQSPMTQTSLRSTTRGPWAAWDSGTLSCACQTARGATSSGSGCLAGDSITWGPRCAWAWSPATAASWCWTRTAATASAGAGTVSRCWRSWTTTCPTHRLHLLTPPRSRLCRCLPRNRAGDCLETSRTCVPSRTVVRPRARHDFDKTGLFIDVSVWWRGTSFICLFIVLPFSYFMFSFFMFSVSARHSRQETLQYIFMNGLNLCVSLHLLLNI